ncbi:MerR family transcriptional regulator [Methylocapsa aurea]|uniref:MerR family transcriptional regulator n=1 Tax=Methylocapsa aurea TaxID=663610 RepID=UPI00068EBF00|nr:MerR family transcriptional regulator [Methylocapsa aurea]
MDTNPAHEKDYHSQDSLARAQPKHEPRSRAARSRGSDMNDGEAQTPKSQERRSTIREMASDFGVSIRTLRFYEDRGLLHPRRVGTARQYGPRDRLYLKMILKGKQLGFTLSEIHDILANRVDVLNPQRNLLDPDLNDMDFEVLNLEMGLPPEQILAQISHLERQRKELDEAIIALRNAHRRLLESPCRAAAS